MKSIEQNYIQILKNILKNGIWKNNRTGVPTLGIFNTQWSSGDLLSNARLPLMTHRKIAFKGALVELFWILGILQAQAPIFNGTEQIDRNNVKYLQREGVNYWNPWADENGDLGPVYGKQLMEWDSSEGPINQIQNIINTLRVNPDDRRLVCTMWNPGELHKMALPPCHHTFEFYSRPVGDERYLDCRFIQRSADFPIGVPFDICLYSILVVMLSKMTNHNPGTVYGLFGDTHIYSNQIPVVEEIIKLENNLYDPPILEYSGPEFVNHLNDFKLEWFAIKDYKNHGVKSMPVSV